MVLPQITSSNRFLGFLCYNFRQVKRWWLEARSDLVLASVSFLFYRWQLITVSTHPCLRQLCLRRGDWGWLKDSLWWVRVTNTGAGYQGSSTSESLANFNLYVVNELADKTRRGSQREVPLPLPV